MEPSSQSPKKKDEVEEVGGIFGIVVIVALLALGGVYFIYTQHQKYIENQTQLEEQAQS